MANKAGLVLDGTGNQGAHIGEEVFWHTGFAQKDFGNVPLGAIDGIDANARWALMFYCLQSPHSTQIDTIELCPPDCSTAEVGFAEVGFAEVSTGEVSTGEVSIVEVSIVEVGYAEVSTAEVGTAEVGCAEVGRAEVGTDKVGFAEVSIIEVGTAEVGFAEVGTAEVSSCCCWMLPSPRIPTILSLSEVVHSVLICHVVYLLCSVLIIERCGYV